MNTVEKWLLETSEIEKTASNKWQSTLEKLTIPELEAIVFEKIAEEDNDDKRYTGALIGGALGGATSGAAGRVLYNTAIRQNRGRGVVPVAVLRALGGAVGGHAYESDWGKRHPTGRYVVPWLTGGTAGLGGAAIGARIAGGRRKSPEVVKTSSLNEECFLAADTVGRILARNST